MSSVFYKKYRRLSGMTVVRHIESFLQERGCPLSAEQKRQLSNHWGENIGNCGDLGLPFQAYTWDKEKYNGNWIARLTFPLFAIFIILMTFVIRPINWLIRGTMWFGRDSKIEILCDKWWIAIFGE
jgi:hypothetical protein